MADNDENLVLFGECPIEVQPKGNYSYVTISYFSFYLFIIYHRRYYSVC